MKKNRVLASIVLTAGLGLSGVTAASASDAAPAQHGHVKGKKVVCLVVHQKLDKERRRPEPAKVESRDGTHHVTGTRAPKGRLPVCRATPPGHGTYKVVCKIHNMKDAAAGAKSEWDIRRDAKGNLVNGKQGLKRELSHDDVIHMACKKLHVHG